MEIVYTPKAYLGFESPSLRQEIQKRRFTGAFFCLGHSSGSGSPVVTRVGLPASVSLAHPFGRLKMGGMESPWACMQGPGFFVCLFRLRAKCVRCFFRR